MTTITGTNPIHSIYKADMLQRGNKCDCEVCAKKEESRVNKEINLNDSPNAIYGRHLVDRDKSRVDNIMSTINCADSHIGAYMQGLIDAGMEPGAAFDMTYQHAACMASCENV